MITFFAMRFAEGIDPHGRLLVTFFAVRFAEGIGPHGRFAEGVDLRETLATNFASNAGPNESTHARHYPGKLRSPVPVGTVEAKGKGRSRSGFES